MSSHSTRHHGTHGPEQLYAGLGAGVPPPPPLPDRLQYGHHQHHHHTHHHPHPPAAPPPYPPVPGAAPGAGAGPNAVYVEPPKIEMQPWARDVWRWLADNTVGVARVDLRRPTPPHLEQYDGNLLVVRSRHSVGSGSGGAGKGRGRQRNQSPAVPAYAAPLYGTPVGYPVALPQPALPVPGRGDRQPLLTGARIKITRSFFIGGRRPGHSLGGAPTQAQGDASDTTDEAERAAAAPASAKPLGRGAVSAASPSPASPPSPARRGWLPRSWSDRPLVDVGVGVNLDVEAQEIQPVARIKIKDLLSIKAFPFGHLKISRSIPLGPLALKFRYELPLAHADRFWEPPARLMVRLDSAAGSGVHLTPGGLEFDEQVLRFGDSVVLRASAGLAFPRQLPWSQDDGPPFRLQVHRLCLKSLW